MPDRCRVVAMDTTGLTLHRVARTRAIQASLAVVVAISVGSAVWGGFVTDDPLGIIASQLSFTPARFTTVVQTWDVGQYLALTATLDFAFPVAYGLAIAGVWIRATRGTPTRWALLVPMAAAGADWLENGLHMAAAATVRAGESPSAAIVGIGSAFAALKWLAIVAAIGAIVVTAVRKPSPAWRITSLALAVLEVLVVVTVTAAAL